MPKPEDIKNKNSTENPDEGNEGDENGGNEETVTIKKSELDRINNDLENYRKATLDRKAAEREAKKKEAEEAAKNTANEAGQSNSITLDEKKIKEIVQQAQTSTINIFEKANEKAAIKEFMGVHKELLDDATWTDFISDYSPRRGKTSKEEILEDFQDAMLVYMRRIGKLDEYLKKEAERMQEFNNANHRANIGHNAGSRGDGSSSGGSDNARITPTLERVSSHFKHDPKEIAKVDVSKDSEINVFTPKKK